MTLFKYACILLLVICCVPDLVTSDFNVAEPNIPVEQFTIQGNGSLTAASMVITLGQPGTASVIYHNTPQNIFDGFTTTFEILVTECDSIPWSNGADGFAFFIASQINTDEDIDFGGSLSLSYKTNIAYIGFDLWLGRFIYHVTDVGVSVVAAGEPNEQTALELNGWRCIQNADPVVSVTIDYTPPSTFRVTSTRASQTGPILLDQTLELDFRPFFSTGNLYVALSGATGGGYMRQEFTSWEFKSKADVVPIIECYEAIEGGQYVAYMGYNNLGTFETYLAIGQANSFKPSPQDRGQVQTFKPGRSDFYPANAFSFIWDGSAVTWNLTSNFVTFDASLPELLCPSNLSLAIRFTAPDNLTESQINSIVQSIASFLEISVSRIRVVGFQFIISKRSTLGDALAELELEIAGAGPDTPDEPTAAQAVQQFVQSAANATRINQVLNQDGSTNIQYDSSSLKELGTEGTGQLTPIPAPVAAPVASPWSTPVNAEVPTTQPVTKTPAVAANEPETTAPLNAPVAELTNSSVRIHTYCSIIVFVIVFVLTM